MDTVMEKVILLQQAAEEVEVTKRNLKGRAADVKRQIRSSISRHLEAMRNREVWLLEQVEVIQHVKEETLCRQLAELNQALGVMQNVMSMLEDNTDANGLEVLEGQVREKVEELHKLSLVAEESDHLTFSGVNFELLEMIHKFGVLDSGSSQLEKQVCTLFQGFHVAESGYSVTSHLKKQPTFYTPSGANQEWILKEGPSEATVQMKFQHPHAELSLTEWLPPSQSAPHTQISSIPQNALPVEQWLSDSHRDESIEDVEGEPTDGNVLSRSTNADVLSLDKWLLKSDGQEIQSSYRVVQQSDVGQWLIVTSGVTSHELNTTLIGETYAKIAASSPDQWLANEDVTGADPQPLRTSLIGDTYARIAASAIENWLAGKRSSEVGKKLSLEEDCSECCNCVKGECEAVSMEFSETSSNLSDWLSVKKEDEEESTEGNFTIKAVDMEDVADWLLWSKKHGKEASHGSSTGSKKYYENLCSSSMGAWLSPASTLPKFNVLSADDTGVKKYAEKLSMDSDQMWLHQPQDGQEPEESSEKITSGMGKYLEALSDDYNQWLVQQPGDASICKWLARSSTATCKNCPKMCSKGLFKVFDEVINHSSENWLLPAVETMQV